MSVKIAIVGPTPNPAISIQMEIAQNGVSPCRNVNSPTPTAINITSSQTLNAALAGFAEAGSDGIIQVSTGGADYASGPTIKNMVAGAVALAEYAHVVAKNYT